jgi:hypothetical protein
MANALNRGATSPIGHQDDTPTPDCGGSVKREIVEERVAVLRQGPTPRRLPEKSTHDRHKPRNPADAGRASRCSRAQRLLRPPWHLGTRRAPHASMWRWPAACCAGRMRRKWRQAAARTGPATGLRAVAGLRYSGERVLLDQRHAAPHGDAPHQARAGRQGPRRDEGPERAAPVQGLGDTVRQHGKGFVSYQWPKPGSDKPVDKVSYVQGFEPWGWVIGSGIYVDDLYRRSGATCRARWPGCWAALAWPCWRRSTCWSASPRADGGLARAAVTCAPWPGRPHHAAHAARQRRSRRTDARLARHAGLAARHGGACASQAS